MSSSPAIDVRDVSKRYRLYGRRSQLATLKSALLGRELSLTPSTSRAALTDVDFSVERGEAFGVIGPNGSGKSTLLKLISGIIKPTRGDIVVDGRVSALIELGAGFHPEISGRENVYINGIMLGLSRKEIDERFDRIVEFAGIGEYLDQPVRTYSSGMYVRLGFSVAIHVDPDILLVDEVLSVGDEDFSQKCVARLQEMHRQGVTMLFVTHQLDLVRKLCDRAIWLEHGRVARIGDPIRVVDDYLQHVAGSDAADSEEKEKAEEKPSEELTEEERWGSGEVVLRRVSLVDDRGRQLVALGGPTPVTIEIDIEAREAIEDCVFGIGIFHVDGTCVYGTNSEIEGWLSTRVAGRGQIRFTMPSLSLVAGRYRIDAAAHSRNGRAYDYRRGVIRFVVGSRFSDAGVYRPEHEWSFTGGVEMENRYSESRVPKPIADSIESASDPPAPDAPFRKRPRRRKPPEEKK